MERVAWDLSNHLGRFHETVFVGKTMDDPGENAATFHRVTTPRSLPTPLDFRVAASRALKRLRPDVTLSLGANCPPGDVYWVQSVHRAYLADSRGPVVRGLQAPPWTRQLMPRHRLILGLEKSYFSNGSVQKILCTSKREIQDLVDIYGVDPSRCQVMPNGFDPSIFGGPAEDTARCQARSDLDMAPEDISVLFVANELHRKGFGPLIRAVAGADSPHLRVDVVGRVTDTDYRTEIARLGLADRIHWHGATPDVARFYAAADVFVLPTQYEPFGIVIVEALASGVPVITSRLAGASAAVEEGGAGILLEDPTDVSELAGALRLAVDPEARARWRAGTVAAAKPYAWPRILERVQSVLEQASPPK